MSSPTAMDSVASELLRLVALYCDKLPEWMGDQPRPSVSPFDQFGATAWVRLQPKGVVGIIGTWNAPVFTLLAPLASAFAAGNRAILKPSEVAPATAAVMALTVSLTGCPPGPPPAEPKPQGPSPASVTAPRPGGSAGAASVSSDGALLAYVHSQLGIDFTSRAEAIAWHRPTDQYRSSRDVFPNATDTTSPAVSGDGRFVFFSPSDAAESGGARLVRYSTITGAIDQFPIDPVLPGYRITEQVASNDGSVVALELQHERERSALVLRDRRPRPGADRAGAGLLRQAQDAGDARHERSHRAGGQLPPEDRVTARAPSGRHPTTQSARYRHAPPRPARQSQECLQPL